MKTSVKTLALIACFPLSVGAQSLRCGEILIAEGTTQAEVAARCGQPARIDRQTIYNEGAAAFPGAPPPGIGVGPPPGLIARSSSDIPVEVWTYNFGPSRLMQRVRFENGVVVKIESLGYGS
jgi:Protein of unknown function (DUF2845)